jgi:hypothetical protein
VRQGQLLGFGWDRQTAASVEFATAPSWTSEQCQESTCSPASLFRSLLLETVNMSGSLRATP